MFVIELALIINIKGSYMKKLMALFLISSFVFAMPVLADPNSQGQRPDGRGELRNRPQTALNLDLLHQQDSADWQIIFLINSLSNKSIY